MRFIILIFCSFLLTGTLTGQSNDDTEHEKVLRVIEGFLYATSHNYPDSIAQYFSDDGRLYLDNAADTVYIVSPQEYSNFFRGGVPGTFNGRSSIIGDIEIVNDIAYAKYSIKMERWNKIYTDMSLLKKIDGKWKIITKSATSVALFDKETKVTKKLITEGLNHPWSMAFISRVELLITEKEGGLVRYNIKTDKKEMITGLPDDIARAMKVDTLAVDKGIYPRSLHGKTISGNRGLFQILLDPDYNDNQLVYLSYSAEDSNAKSALKVIRAQLDGNVLKDHKTLLIAGDYVDGLWHYGGGMTFGSDGKLYITAGDRIFFEYIQGTDTPVAQDLTNGRGKIYRINSDGSIPKDNPDFGENAVPGLYAVGIRAAQGIQMNPIDNQIWFTEHGTNQGDELNLLKAGANYGWPLKTTGTYRNNWKPQETDLETETPKHYWHHTVAPTGLCFYNGSEFLDWKNSIILTGLSKGSLWRLGMVDNEVAHAEELFVNDRVRARNIAVSPAGYLFILTDEDNGKLIRITKE